MDYDKENVAARHALPTPSDTPYRTPVGSQSRNVTPSPDRSSSPVIEREYGGSRSRVASPEVGTKEHISQTDPRRFTPTLHASLVGEILSLRRELESKNKDITQLEDVLQVTKVENEQLATNLSTSNRENRTLKKQMEVLEGETHSALNELASQREDVVRDLEEARRRLDITHKKVKSHEEQAERTQKLYDSDKTAWEADKRALETKIHIVEGRLKVVLSEVAASQEASDHGHLETLAEEGEGDSTSFGRPESASSVHPKSIAGRRRASTASSGPHDLHIPQKHHSVDEPLKSGSGLSLADELAMSDDDQQDDSEYLDEDEEGSLGALPEERPWSVQSRPRNFKARKLLGLSTEVQSMDSADLQALSILDGEMDKQDQSPAEYVDSATQYSPPPTPTLQHKDRLDSLKEDQAGLLPDIVANQGRKRVAEKRSMDDLRALALKSNSMTSTSSQTSGDLPSPPTTPKMPSLDGIGPDVEGEGQEAAMVSKHTQTDGSQSPTTAKASSPVFPIPKIAIHPPSSRPATPREGVVLPPHTKNATCQVNSSDLTGQRSIGIQTEGIRIDSRPVKLPPHLIPGPTIRPRSPEMGESSKTKPPRRLRSPPPVASNIQTSKSREKTLMPAKKLGLGNDTGRLTKDMTQDIRRPERSSSLFAGFDAADDEMKPSDLATGFDDDDIFNRPMVSYTLRGGKMIKATDSTTKRDISLDSDNIDAGDVEKFYPSVEEQPETLTSNDVPGATEHEADEEDFVIPSRSANQRPRPLRLAANSIRRTALISSGNAAHQATRARSPSLPSSDNPPFPVPTRHSSRKIPISSSDGARSPTPNGNRYSYDEEPNLRKSRSAAAIAQQDRYRSETPPLLTASTIPESPDLPPMPSDQVSPFGFHQTFRSPEVNRWTAHEQEMPRPESPPSSQTTVVDAIAQTMVGEWMWKYVRRGKSFGATEVRHPDWDTGKSGDDLSNAISNSGSRHRRWVWLAPYERAVMWSSKQPTSGPALLGKSGRKLSIQSVLDVRDDNTLPKGSDGCFNRSILILTPQRALKFTAVSQERHYVWLSALSFLSHSPNDISDLGTVPPSISYEESAPPPVPTRSSRRPAIRDSIRVTKGRNGAGNKGMRAFTADSIIPRVPENQTNGMQYTYEDQEAADAPNVPRTSNQTSHHTRKRSNTAPRPPPTSFKTYPFLGSASLSRQSTSAGSSSIDHPTQPYSATSVNTGTSSVGHPSMTTAGGIQSTRSSMSRRTSLSSGQQAQAMNNYFDNLGTMRMEAFISRQDHSDSIENGSNNGRHRHYHARGTGAMGSGSTSTGGTGTMRSRSSYRTRQGRKKDMSYWGAPASVASGDVRSIGGTSEGSVRDRDSWALMRDNDPFRGF